MSEERGTFKDIVQDKTIASYRQIDYWITNGCCIGQKPEKEGSGYYRSYDALDVKILNWMAVLSDLMGGSMPARSFKAMDVLIEFSKTLRRSPELADRSVLYVDKRGRVFDQVVSPGWVLSFVG